MKLSLVEMISSGDPWAMSFPARSFCFTIPSPSFREALPKMLPEQITHLIETAIPGAQVQVHSDDNTHFEAVVVAPQFEDKRSLQRHQLVYAALGDRMGGEIHALSIKAFTPAEWAAREA